MSGLDAPEHRWRAKAPPHDGPRLLDPPSPEADLAFGLGESPSLRQAAALAFERRRGFVLLPFAIIAGLIAYRIWPGEPARSVYLVAGAAIVLAIPFARITLDRLRFLSFAAAFVLGFALLPLHGLVVGTPMLDWPRYGSYDVRVELVLREEADSIRLLVGDIRALDETTEVPDIRYARLTYQGALDVAPGNRLSGMMRFYPVPGPIVPGGYDAQFTSYFDGVGAYGTAFGAPAVQPLAGNPVRTGIEAVRSNIADRISAVLGPRVGSIATALITGDQSRIAEEDWEVMALAGLAHVISISGLHLTLVAGVVYAGARLLLALAHPLVGRLHNKTAAAVLGIVAAFGYLTISGMSVPAVRSTLMIALVFAAVVVGRRALTMRNVALAALLVIAFDPASVFSASFQLSFSAVVALIAAYEMVADSHARRPSEVRRSRLWTVFAGTAMTSIVAGGATALFTAYHFQQTAPFGLLGNLAAMPVISFVMMPAALVSVLLMPFGLETVPLEIMGRCIEIMLAIARWVGAISGGFDPSPILAPAALVVLGAGLAWLAFLEGRWRLLGPALAVPIVLFVTVEERPSILIADGTQAVAVREGEGMILISGRNDTFATDVWSERYIETITTVTQADHCDEIGCVFVLEPYGIIALPKHVAAVRDDCASASLVIARFPVGQYCHDLTQVIDSDDLRSGGAHALYWADDQRSFRVRPVIDDPTRPWRIVY